MDKKLIEEAMKPNDIFRWFESAPLKPSEYAILFKKLANDQMKFSEQEFVVDDDNKGIINNLYFYLMNSGKCEWDLNKGIIIIGAIGCGKTIIMETFVTIFNLATNKHIMKFQSKEIPNEINERGLDFFNKRPIYIDDIAKEPSKSLNYGTLETPMSDIIEKRYKSNALTLATSNLELKDMKYENHIKDRISQMFNIVKMKGKSRRS